MFVRYIHKNDFFCTIEHFYISYNFGTQDDAIKLQTNYEQTNFGSTLLRHRHPSTMRRTQNFASRGGGAVWRNGRHAGRTKFVAVLLLYKGELLSMSRHFCGRRQASNYRRNNGFLQGMITLHNFVDLHLFSDQYYKGSK